MFWVFVLGVFLTILAYPILKFIGNFSRFDAASIAAHYGSVSVGTFAVAVAYMNTLNISYEEHMPLLLVVLEIPAIIVGILLAKGLSSETNWREVSHEIITGKGIMLLLGGVVIGWVAGPEKMQSLAPLFFDLFKGILALFLLEMGLIAASRLSALKRYGFFIVGFFGVLVGYYLEFSVGGIAMLAVLASSASYIAVPAAMRISVPEANPTLSLTASLGVTFPFNILIGIPIYHQMAIYTNTLLGG